MELPGHHGLIYDAVWSPDDSMLATASSDFTVKVWGMKAPHDSHETTVLQHSCFAYSCAFHPVSSKGSYLVTGAYDGTMKIWNARRAKVVDILKVGLLVS